MKTILLTAGKDNEIHSTVRMNGHETDTLTPAMARSASRTAFGHGDGDAVTDNFVTYRLRSGKTRKVETL